MGMEIKSLKVQLKSSISASSAMHFTSANGGSSLSSSRPTSSSSSSSRSTRITEASPERNVLTERRQSLDNVTPDQSRSKKQVSWKNTPQVIPASDRKKKSTRARYQTSTVSSRISTTAPSTSASAARRATPSRNKLLGSASRVLQTPGKQSVRAPRRVPAAADSRRKWN